jgi:hypothetical protein
MLQLVWLFLPMLRFSIEELNANKDKFRVKLLVLVVALVFIATRLKQ